MFPQLGAPIGFLASSGLFLLLTSLTGADFLLWGWRLPFSASAVLVFVGLYVRLRLTETREFQQALRNNERVRNPIWVVVTRHCRELVLGTLTATAAFVIFYIMTVFSLSWATSKLGFARPQVLLAQIIGMSFLFAVIPVSAGLAKRLSARSALLIAKIGLMIFGVFFGALLGAGSYAMLVLTIVLGLGLAGLSYGPLGVALAELFPTPVRYTGISLTFNLAGILGASLTPYIATALASSHGLPSVGYYLTAMAVVSWIALMVIGRQKAPA